jgi:serine protease Do
LTDRRDIVRWGTVGVLLGTTLCHLASPIQAAEMRPEQIVRQYGRAVVMVTVADASDVQGFGTGFVVSPDGLVITNYHVVRNAIRSSIRLTNGRQYRVQWVVATDSAKDLALLKVNARGLPTVRMGSTGAVGVGARVYVIGNPEGLQNTLSDGLLSAKRQFASLRAPNKTE